MISGGVARNTGECNLNSIVYRGIPHETFYENLQEVRNWHSGEIILSTWDDIEINNDISPMLDCIVRSKDPGEDLDTGNASLRFASRQAIAAKAGIDKAAGEKVLLSRTDIRHRESLFNKVEINESQSSYKVFSAPLVVGSIMSIDPDSGFDAPRTRFFRICDWFQCGYRSDLEKFTDIQKEIIETRHSGCCLEQLWFVCCFNKQCRMNLNPNCLEDHQNVFWGIVAENFKIINSQGFNTGKWSRKTNLQEYISEEKYNQKLKQIKAEDERFFIF